MIGTKIGPIFVAGRPVRGSMNLIGWMFYAAFAIVVGLAVAAYYVLRWTALGIIAFHAWYTRRHPNPSPKLTRYRRRLARRALAAPPTGPPTYGLPTP